MSYWELLWQSLLSERVFNFTTESYREIHEQAGKNAPQNNALLFLPNDEFQKMFRKKELCQT